MPLKLISGGGGSVILSANSTGSNYTVTMPAENGVAVTSGATTRLVPTAALPVGTVLQYVDYTFPSVNDDYVVISNGATYDIPAPLSITPRYATSKLVIHAECQIRIQEADGLFSGIKRDGTKMAGAWQNSNTTMWFFYKNTLDNHHVQCQLNTSVTAGSTATTTFNQWISPYNGSGEWSKGWGLAFIQIWEIAQ